MAKHKHVMRLDHAGDDGRWWFCCEACPAEVEIVPSFPRLNTVNSSARVRNEGIGGFSVDELMALSRLWLEGFVSYAVSCRPRSAPVQRRRRRAG